MHIPLSESTEINILTFEEAKKKKYNSIEYDDNRWIYIPDFYSEYRYILGSIGNKPLIVIGLNPSTATPNELDNTLKSVNRIALNNNFDSFIMLNLYAQRATRPNDMDGNFNNFLHSENMKAFKYVLENSGSLPNIWAAWGAIIDKRPYLKNCLKDMFEISCNNKTKVRWLKANELTKKGHPRHPLYLSNKSQLSDFDIQSYLLGL